MIYFATVKFLEISPDLGFLKKVMSIKSKTQAQLRKFDRWSDDDSKEKRAIGQVWEEKSAEQCLFIMPKGPDWNAILAKLG